MSSLQQRGTIPLVLQCHLCRSYGILWPLAVAIFTERLQNRQPIPLNGAGEQQRDLVYVADVVDALLTMARSNRDGTGVSTSILELLHALEKEIEPAKEIRHGPRRPGDVNNSSLAIGSIENDLGWRPKYDLADGIADMIRKANADR
jgi:nucleoside-diphosphate-sugar epimerase